MSLLFHAVVANDLDQVNSILNNSQVPFDDAALGMALAMSKMTQKKEIVFKILNDPRVNPHYQNGVNLIKIIDFHDDEELINRLFKLPKFNPDNLLIIYATKVENYSFVSQCLKDSRIDPSARDNLALHYAKMNENLFLATQLLLDPRVFRLAQIPCVCRNLSFIHPQWDLWLDQAVKNPKSLAALAWRKMIDAELEKFTFDELFETKKF